VSIEPKMRLLLSGHGISLNNLTMPLRWLSYGIFIIGLGLAVFLYVTAAAPPPYPLGYDHDLEGYEPNFRYPRKFML